MHAGRIDLDADLPEIAEWAIAECRVAFPFTAATIYVQEPDGYSAAYGRLPGEASARWPGGVLLKWLRVNDCAASMSDPTLIEDFTRNETAGMHREGWRAAAPLVFRGTLEALVAMTAERAPTAGELDQLTRCARAIAPRWHRSLERRAANRRRERAYRSEQLATAGQLAATVAHEVRNPLAAVRSVVQLVRDGALEDGRRSQLLSGVLSEVDRIDEHVANLLGLARVHTASPARQALTPVVQEAARFMDAYARDRGIELSVSAAAVPECQASFDARELRQILLNILLNACQACRRGDAIRMEVVAADPPGRPWAEVQVADTGPGMDDATLTRVFEGFFTTKDGGTGLGLVTSRDLLRRGGGDLTLDSTPGFGTRVTLRLPATTETHGPSADHR